MIRSIGFIQDAIHKVCGATHSGNIGRVVILALTLQREPRMRAPPAPLVADVLGSAVAGGLPAAEVAAPRAHGPLAVVAVDGSPASAASPAVAESLRPAASSAVLQAIRVCVCVLMWGSQIRQFAPSEKRLRSPLVVSSWPLLLEVDRGFATEDRSREGRWLGVACPGPCPAIPASDATRVAPRPLVVTQPPLGFRLLAAPSARCTDSRVFQVCGWHKLSMDNDH